MNHHGCETPNQPAAPCRLRFSGRPRREEQLVDGAAAGVVVCGGSDLGTGVSGFVSGTGECPAVEPSSGPTQLVRTTSFQ